MKPNMTKEEKEKKIKEIDEMTFEEKMLRLTRQQFERHQDVFIRLKNK